MCLDCSTVHLLWRGTSCRILPCKRAGCKGPDRNLTHVFGALKSYMVDIPLTMCQGTYSNICMTPGSHVIKLLIPIINLITKSPPPLQVRTDGSHPEGRLEV